MSGDNGGWHLVRGAFYPLKRLAEADARVSLITAVSRDEYGDRALENVQRAGANCQHSLRTSKLPTAKTIILEDAVGSLKRYVVERGAMQLLDPEYILARQHVIARASVLLLDASLNADVLRTLLSIVKHANLQAILFLPEEGECVATLRNQVAADLDKIAIVAAAKDVGTQLKEPVQDTESCVRTAVKLLEAGGDTVLVWWKGQGAAVATSESAIFIPQLPVQEDLPYDLYSFGAAVAEARGRGFSWRQAVRKSLSAHPGRIVKTS
ncbi:hypothetical protein SY88_00725 [Clostridiales bacterium PH28_bin88]|nr:hypothetical protein SY88_00725 [Clostridiales bacterium PH28_bin88]